MKSEPSKDERRFLVVACGRECESHPHERWVSVDPSKSRSPDILSTLEFLNDDHFRRINANTKFNIVYIERIPHSANSHNQFQKAFSLLDNNGAFIQDGSDMSELEEPLP